MLNEVEEGKIVLTHGSVHYQRIVTDEICKMCSTGCKTDCLRYNGDIERTGTDTNLFNVDQSTFEFNMYDDYDSCMEADW